MSRYPRPVEIARRILIPTSSVFLIATGAWFLTQGQKRAAATSFILAASALASIPLSRVLDRYVGRREIRDSISVRADPATALRWTREALQELAPESEVEVDPTRLVVWIEVPRSWKTWGERVTSVVHLAEAGSKVEITSECLFPQLLDSGKNRSNVEAVINRLSSLDSEAWNKQVCGHDARKCWLTPAEDGKARAPTSCQTPGLRFGSWVRSSTSKPGAAAQGAARSRTTSPTWSRTTCRPKGSALSGAAGPWPAWSGP